jgi:large repetitive protein
LTVDDGLGNTESCTATVTVEDNIPPTAVCQDITVQVGGAGSVTISADDIDNGSTDNCGIASMSVSPDSFTCADAGANTVTLTVTDASGNTSTCTATVTVETVAGLTAICQNVTVQLDANGSASITTSDIDNGSGADCGTANLSLDRTEFDCSDLGANTVTLTVDDGLGNTESCTATVTVEDNIPPVAVCQDITVQVGGAGSVTISADDIDNGSTDNCGIASMTVSPDSFTCADAGANTVTLTVTDASGNTSTCTATVTVETVAGLTALCQNVTVQLDANGSASITTSDIDNGSGADCGTANLSLDRTEFDCSDLGANTVTLTVDDGLGNTESCTATVTVEDNIPPTAVCQDITVQVGGAGSVTISADDIDNGSTDNCGIAR